MKKRIAVLLGLILAIAFVFCAAQAEGKELGSTGWVDLEDGRYYGDVYGYAVTGQCIIDDQYCFFDETGLLQTGWIKAEDNWWTVYNDGEYQYSTSSSRIKAGWRYADQKGKILMSLEGLSSLRIPAAVDSLPDGFFEGVKRDFIIQCDPGSYAEKLALSLGMPYDNGKKKVLGTSITNVDEKADWVIKNYITSDMSDREKAKRLHNWLIYNAHYDYTFSNYNADGVLVKGFGVCDSYSRAYSLLLTRVGIENKRLTGKCGTEGHAWNLVKIDGQWYHVDCTWDDPNDSGEASVSGWEGYDYFLVGDDFVKQSRTFDEDVSADSNYVRWVTMGEEKYYYGPEGKRLTGWQDIGTSDYYRNGVLEKSVPCHYYFNENGVMQTGFQVIGGATYYFGNNGMMQTGWQTVAEDTYYFGEDGKALTGWQDITETKDVYNWEKGEWEDQEVTSRYYFNEKGVMQTGLQTIAGSVYFFSNEGIMQTGWKIVEEKRYYFREDGAAATGLQEIDGAIYCFDETCAAVTDWYMPDGQAVWYFAWDGKRADGDTWIDGVMYRFNGEEGLVGQVVDDGYDAPQRILQVKAEKDPNGKVTVALTDTVLSISLEATGWKEINGSWYYGDENRNAVTGPATIGGVRYCFDELGRMVTGWAQVEDHWYCASSTGALYCDGWRLISGAWYYFLPTGEMATGWISDGGAWYYFLDSGIMATGWVEDDGKWYYLQDNGAAYSGWLQSGNDWYYLQSGGGMATGWIYDGGTWYYMKSSGEMATGWKEIKGDWYYFGSSGAMRTDWQEISCSWYYFNASGIMQTGWQRIGGKWYCFDDSGEMVTGWMEDRKAEAKLPEGKKKELWYWFDEKGAMVTGWKKIKGEWYCFDKDGTMQTGWLQDGSSWFYLGSGGAMVTGEVTISGVVNVFNANGVWVGEK